MPTTVTIQRGQGSVACQGLFINATYPNGQSGGTVTMVTAPSSGVSRIILNQLTINQTSPTAVNTSNGQQDAPNGGINAYVYLGNNYNGDGSTRYLSPIGSTSTGGSVSRLAFPPGQTNTQKVGTSTNSLAGGVVFTAGPGFGTQYPWQVPGQWGQPSFDSTTDASANVFCIMPNNIYMGPNDILTCRVGSSLTSNTSVAPTYQVTWSFTLITET
jgi:hypothetical protein